MFKYRDCKFHWIHKLWSLKIKMLIFVNCFVTESGSHDEGIHIPRSKVSHNHVAKSLPVNVPTYIPVNRRGMDIDDERVSCYTNFIVNNNFINIQLL